MIDQKKGNNGNSEAFEGAFVQAFEMFLPPYVAGLVITMPDPEGSGLIFEYVALAVDEGNGIANWYGDEEAVTAAHTLLASLGKIGKGQR